MTARHDLDRLITTWLTDEVGPVEAPDYFAETLDLVDRTPQRRVWPWSGLAIPRRWTRIDLPAGVWAAILVGLLALALVVAALIGAFRTPPPVPTGPGRIVVTQLDGPLVVINPDGGSDELPRTEGSPTMASVSPDGTRVAWWTWMTETSNDGIDTTWVPLSIAALDGSNSQVVLDGLDPPIGFVEERPQWSPDGRFLVFSVGGSLYRIEVETKALTTLAGDGQLHRSSPTWSPDGAWIAFHASPPETEPVMRPLGAVHVIRPDGTDETVVSGETVVWSGNFGPAWSADSRRLAYVTPETLVHPEFGEYTVPKGIEIATRASSGWTRSPVAGVEGIGDQVMLLWAPVGERLAFVRELGADPEGFLQSALTVVEPDGTLRTVTEEPVSQGFCWSYDATRIAAITVEGRLLAFDVATGVEVADFGTTVLNVGDACVWSGWAGQSN